MPDRPYRWDARTGRYHHPTTGRMVGLPQVRAAIDAALDRAEEEVRTLAEQLRDGQISLVQWELQMREQAKSVALYSYAGSVGGWAQLSPAQLGRIGAEVRAQYGFLRQMARDIESGKQRMDGTLLSRSALYVRNGRKVHAIAQREQMTLRGYDEERNERYAGDSCPGCIAAEAAGWVPVGTLPLPGNRDCYNNCRCVLRYRNATTGEAAA